MKAIVTGAGRGLGRVIATALAGRGYDLVITARTASELEEAASQLRVHGTRIDAIAGDITDPEHRRRLVAAAGVGVDVLVNNASELGPMASLTSYPLERLPFETNVVAPLALIQEAKPAFVVNITSDAAVGSPGTELEFAL